MKFKDNSFTLTIEKCGDCEWLELEVDGRTLLQIYDSGRVSIHDKYCGTPVGKLIDNVLILDLSELKWSTIANYNQRW